MYIIGNSLCEYCNVGGNTHLWTLQCREEGESCNVHLYNANSFCFNWFSVLFIWNLKLPAGIYLVAYKWNTPFSALKLQQTLILTLSDDSLFLSALLFLFKKSMPQYIAHIPSLGWCFASLHQLLLEKVGCVVGQDTLKHVSNSACAGRAHLLPELGGLILHEALVLAACRCQCVSFWLRQPHGRECAVHGAPSPWAGDGVESTQCLLGKTQFFSFFSQDTCFKCSFLRVGSSPSDELVAIIVHHSQGDGSKASNKAECQSTPVTGWCPLLVLTNGNVVLLWGITRFISQLFGFWFWWTFFHSHDLT